MNKVLLSFLVYPVIVFPLAITWHMVLFRDFYTRIGFFGDRPSFVLGFLAMLVQSAVLAWLFPRIALPGRPLARSLSYALTMGVFFWSSHVVAAMAKSASLNSAAFLGLESAYLALQFGLFGLALGVIYRNPN